MGGSNLFGVRIPCEQLRWEVLVSRQDMLIVLGGLAIAVLGGLAYYYRYHQRVELSDNLGPSLG